MSKFTAPISVLLVALSATALVACDRKEERTAGQQLDQTIQNVENKVDKAKENVQENLNEAKQDLSQAAQAVEATAEDAGITAAINAALAKDHSLEAIKIDVDTHQGKVTLKGVAPSKTARDRATELAKEVKGVVSVDNQLDVRL